MAQVPSLAQRFVAGSNRIHVTIPEQRAFFIGMPQDVRDLKKISSAMLAARVETVHELQRGFAEQTMAINEIRGQLSSLEFAVSEGFQELSDAVVHLEDTLCAELGEVKWVLGQMDGKLGELVHLVKFPRETEARELVEDGVKALATGHLDDAEYCLAKAVETKRTSFQGNMNLAFVFLHKDDAEHAIAHFRKAADYAPAADKDGAKVLALENLARAYFAASNFAAARENIEQALALRAQHRDRSLHSEYQHATYCVQAGDTRTAVQNVVNLCREAPQFFLAASTDSDLEPARNELLKALDELANDEQRRADEMVAQARRNLDLAMGDVRSPAAVLSETATLRKAVQEGETPLHARDFSSAFHARLICTVAASVAVRLAELARLRENLKTDTAALKEAEQVLTPIAGENDARRKRFDEEQRGGSSTGKSTATFIGVSGSVLACGALIVWGIKRGNEWWGPSGVLIAIVLLVLVGIYPAVLMIGLFNRLGEMIGSMQEKNIRARQWQPAPEFLAASHALKEARANFARTKDALDSIERFFGERLAEIRRLLEMTP
jgi:tetratricopeptide (TPR) repeat protein